VRRPLHDDRRVGREGERREREGVNEASVGVCVMWRTVARGDRDRSDAF
jgi:hypothetical protein